MATGFYHKFNTLKYRILHVLIRANEPLTTIDIAYEIGIERKRVSDALSHYYTHGYGYTKRLKIKRGKYHLYTISKKGIEAYKQYDARFKQGLSLNRMKSKSQKMNSVLDYFGVNKIGQELGISKDDIPKLAGLKKRNLDTNEH